MAAARSITVKWMTVLLMLTVKAAEADDHVCYDDDRAEYYHGQQINVDCNTCTCLDSGWNCTEIACSDPCFSSPCQNGGLCSKWSNYYDEHNTYECICARNYTGYNCQYEISPGTCYDGLDTLENGESFRYWECRQQCECDDGVVSCDLSECGITECSNSIYSPVSCCPVCWPEEKAGYCPERSFADEIGTCEESCRYDVDCTGSQKCCFNGCGMSCADPQSEPTALCAADPCKNGGTCIDVMSTVYVCQCLPGYYGEHCEQKDGESCYHDGSWYRDGETEFDLTFCLECTCRDGFFKCTDQCARKPGECPDTGYYYYFDYHYECLLDSDCPNDERCCNGQCLIPDGSGTACTYRGIHLKNGETYHETCHFCICKRGEMHCDSSLCANEKPGTCPNIAGGVGICVTECNSDTECSGISKCCFNGCGDVCVPPQEAGVMSSCYFEDNWHGDGEIFTSECGTCHCEDGTVLCRNPICPELHCYDPVHVESKCCPICIEEGNPGYCPDIPTYSPSPSQCLSTCYYDNYCESDEKCCQTSCGGYSCVQPVGLDHEGKCPFLTYDGWYYTTAFTEECHDDDHCADNEKCCFDMNQYKVCMESIPEDLEICEDQPCLNGGTCTVVTSFFSVDTYSCTCTHGYTGVNCEETDELCAGIASPCLNGGHCTGYDGYPCDCQVGFSGMYCEDECDQTICFNDGTCTGYDFEPCVCPSGFIGDFCEIDLCDPSPCKNGGTCSGIDWYPCYCTERYGGDHCDEENVCFSQPCMNGGFCISNVDFYYYYDTDNSSICSCLSGYGGDFCEEDLCEPNPCQNGGTCSGLEYYPCYCAYGYTGDYCDEEDICSSQPCMNGGICYGDYDFSSYSSFSSYSFLSSGPCWCLPGYSGDYCEEEACQDNPCQNNGTCTGYSFWPCLCPYEYTGDYCEEESDYTFPSWWWDWDWSSWSSDDSYDTPTPYSDDNSGEVTVDWVDSDDDDDRKPPDTNPCMPNPCLNNGVCERIGEYYPYIPYYCECAPGFDGDLCEKDNRCEDNYCDNEGVCVQVEDSYYYYPVTYCECPRNVYGTYCEIVSPCAARPCHHGGTCSWTYSDFYTCDCPPGTSGENCEVHHKNVCEKSPCMNFGSCTEFQGVADCSCVSGFTGRFCEINIEYKHCPDKSYADQCLFDPCTVAIGCPMNPSARCESNYCGCIAEFYDEIGRIVQCHDCGDEDVVTCVINPCQVTTCASYPNARCEVNNCGTCRAEFYDEQENILDCEGITCKYSDRNYNVAEIRDHTDACNTCTCNSKGQWICTSDQCPGNALFHLSFVFTSRLFLRFKNVLFSENVKVVVQMQFSLDWKYEEIENEIEVFINDIISQLASQFGISEDNFKDVQVYEGSIIVEFKLVNEEEIDPEEVASSMADELKSGNVEFEYDEQTIPVIPGTVKEPQVVVTKEEDDDNKTIIIAVVVTIVVLAVVVSIIVALFVMNKRKVPKTSGQVMPNLHSNPYANLDKSQLSGTVVYDNLGGGASIQGSDNPTYTDINDIKKA
ncbi:uncharacterized protein [Antedon mediterranea]|uniref:uncharacterized protein n=1 Tax=Antedon mediterranea TaxID=105859 RepID=UPI003AF90FB3